MIPVIILLSLISYGTPSHSNVLTSNEDRKTAIVTGANRGMGLGWVKHFLSEGYTVVATARKPEKATALHELQKQYTGKLLIQQLDVTSEEHMAGLSKMLEEKMLKIDIAISNAGVTVLEDFGNWTAEGFGYNYKVNTLGAALFAQAIAPSLSNGATLIQITSGGGSITWKKKSSEYDGYCVSKAGLNMLTKALSYILADKEVIVVSMTPGQVNTDMNPSATRSVEEAVAEMSETISKLTIENTATFINFKGDVYPW